MTDESIEQVGLDQRATDPRLDAQPLVEPIVEPTVENNDSVDDTADQEPVLETPVVKPKKTAEEVLKGRVGHLTKTLSAKDEALAAAEARALAAETLLASAGRVVANPDGTAPEVAPAPVVTPSGQKTYSQADFETAVAARAEVEAFNKQADVMYNTGAEKFPDWKDAVDTLVVSGFMNKDLLDAAMAVDDGATVVHYLGTNLDEAERINSLSPIRKTAEIVKLATSLNTPRHVPVSGAPTPIRPVNGSPSPAVDLQRVADNDDMSAYVAARAKTGSRWAQPRGQRG